MPRLGGFTLWELLWVMAIGGTALGLAVPTFRAWVLDTRRTADVNGFVLAVQVARTEAAKRGRPVILCRTRDWARCTPESDSETGWMVFVNTDDLTPPHRSPAEPLIFTHDPEIEGTITSNRPYFEFRPRLRRSTNGTVVFCDGRGPHEARAVIVSYTGRPRVDLVNPDGKPLPCAQLS